MAFGAELEHLKTFPPYTKGKKHSKECGYDEEDENNNAPSGEENLTFIRNKKMTLTGRK